MVGWKLGTQINRNVRGKSSLRSSWRENLTCFPPHMPEKVKESKTQVYKQTSIKTEGAVHILKSFHLNQEANYSFFGNASLNRKLIFEGKVYQNSMMQFFFPIYQGFFFSFIYLITYLLLMYVSSRKDVLSVLCSFVSKCFFPKYFFWLVLLGFLHFQKANRLPNHHSFRALCYQHILLFNQQLQKKIFESSEIMLKHLLI